MAKSWMSVGVMLALLGAVSGCKLLTVEFPDQPLSELEINARLATSRFIDHFSVTVREAADETAELGGRQARIEALRWKLGSLTSVRSAAFQVSPRDALADTWVYCVQMQAFFETGAGRDTFGPHQSRVVEAASGLSADVTELSLAFLTPEEQSIYSSFVSEYAEAHPLEDITAPRPSSVPALHERLQIDPESAIQTVGSLPQVVADFGTRMTMVTEEVADQASWRTELMLLESGMDRVSVRAELDSLGQRLDRFAAAAEAAPEVVDNAMDRLNTELTALMEAVDLQREATLEALGRERAALTEAIAREREVSMAELERYSNALIADAWEQIHSLATTAVVGVVAVIVVLLGAPFGLGVLVGRVTKRGV